MPAILAVRDISDGHNSICCCLLGKAGVPPNTGKSTGKAQAQRVVQSKCQITPRSRNLFELEEGTPTEMRCLGEARAMLWHQNKTEVALFVLRFGLWEQKGRKGEGKGNLEDLWIIYFSLWINLRLLPMRTPQQDIEKPIQSAKVHQAWQSLSPTLPSSQRAKFPQLLKSVYRSYFLPDNPFSKSLWGNLTVWGSYLHGLVTF